MAAKAVKMKRRPPYMPDHIKAVFFVFRGVKSELAGGLLVSQDRFKTSW
jgi:hypothetical protein